jgi:hypothetical protein
MNPSKTNRILILAISLLFAYGGKAQGNANNSVPPNVSAAFTTKYPQAQLRHWKEEKSIYMAKFELNGHKYTAIFNAQGNWIETDQNIAWPWHLPEPVKSSFQKSKHGDWNIYEVTHVENPLGTYYQIGVDNANHTVGISHAIVMDSYWLVDIKPDGELIDEKNDSAAPIHNPL